jgi:integrase
MKRKPGNRREVRGTSVEDKLVALLRLRPSTVGGVYELDLRNKEWGRTRDKVLTLRCPSDPGWPGAGRTTGDRAVAEEWVRKHYGPMVQREREIAERGADLLTVQEACRNFLQFVEREKGARHSTAVGHRSNCSLHIIPALGPLRLSAIPRERVRTFLENLQVYHREPGRRTLRPASQSTRQGVRNTLSAVWHYVFPDAGEPPFAGIRIVDKEKAKVRIEAAEKGERPPATVYDRDQIALILTAAMWYDRRVLARPNIAAVAVPCTAEIVAFLYGTMPRITEAAFVRWRDVDRERRAIYVPGTKNDNAPRWIPAQQTLWPWLDRLRGILGDAEPYSYVVRIRPSRPMVRASRKTLGGRISKVLGIAGLKWEGEATHIFRASHMSVAAFRIPGPALKLYAGHSSAHGGATDAYVTTSPPFMPEEHRHYLDIPSPEEIMQRLEHFTPAERLAGDTGD